MVNSWRVLDSRSAVIPNRILRRLVLPARNAAKILYYVKPRKAEDITDVRIIRNVISCHGQSRHLRNVRSAEVIW